MPNVKYLLHSLQMSELEIVSNIKTMFSKASVEVAREIVQDVLKHCNSFPISTHLCAGVLREALRGNPPLFCSVFNRPELIYELLNDPDSESEVGTFFYELALIKSKLGQSFSGESHKLLTEICLRGRSSVADAPPVQLRLWLVRIWTNVPESFPSNLDAVKTAIDWLGRTTETPHIIGLLTWLQTLKQSYPSSSVSSHSNLRRDSPATSDPATTNTITVGPNPHKADIHIVSAFLKSLLVRPQGQIAQLALLLVSLESLPFVLASIIHSLSVADLSTLWTRIISWTPVVPSHYGLRLQTVLFNGTASPLTFFASVYLRVTCRVLSERRILAERLNQPPPETTWTSFLEFALRLIVCKMFSAETFHDASQTLGYLCLSEVPLRETDSVIVPQVKDVVKSLLSSAIPQIIGVVGLGQFAESDLRHVAEELGIRFDRADNKEWFEPEITPKSAPVLPDHKQEDFTSILSVLPPGPLALAGIERVDEIIPVIEGPTDLLPFRDRPVGIQNYNNTCHLSTILQSWFLTSSFFEALMVARHNPDIAPMGSADEKVKPSKGGSSHSLIDALKLLFTRLQITQHPHVEISDLIRQLPATFRSGEEQDASETCRGLLDYLKESETAPTRLSGTFAGSLVRKTKCFNCQTITERKEHFHDIVLSVPKASDSFGKTLTVQNLLEDFFKPEMMDGSNKYMCERCNSKQDAQRWTEIIDLPNHLIFVMSRFSYDVKLGDFKKENTIVQPERVVINNKLFSLYSAVLHEGASITKGHYVTIGQRDSLPSPSWYLLDDSDSTAMSKENAAALIDGSAKPTHTSYLLFYKLDKLKANDKLSISKDLIAEARSIENAAVHL